MRLFQAIIIFLFQLWLFAKYFWSLSYNSLTHNIGHLFLQLFNKLLFESILQSLGSISRIWFLHIIFCSINFQMTGFYIFIFMIDTCFRLFFLIMIIIYLQHFMDNNMLDRFPVHGCHLLYFNFCYAHLSNKLCEFIIVLR